MYYIDPNIYLGINLLYVNVCTMIKLVRGLFGQTLLSKIQTVTFLNQGLIQRKELFKTQEQLEACLTDWWWYQEQSHKWLTQKHKEI